MLKGIFGLGISLLMLGLTGILCADDNLMPNPGAEEVISFKDYPQELIRPYVKPAKFLAKGWGCYGGSGWCTWGVTDKEAHKGKYSAFLTFTEFKTNKTTGKKRPANIDLLIGESNGYIGKRAIEALPDTNYYFSFWIKGNVPAVTVRVFGWKTEQAIPGDREFIKTSLKKINPTQNWTKYQGSFTTTKNTEKFAIGLHIARLSVAPGQTIYVDNVTIKSLPQVMKIDNGSPNPVKVGIYDNGTLKASGRRYIYEALKGEKGIIPKIITDLRAETLKEQDVLVLSSIRNLSPIDIADFDNGRSWMRSLLNFVDSGKGIVLGHDCVGYRGAFGVNKIFPTIAVGKGKVNWEQKLQVTTKDHPVMKNVPEKFSHSYFDHITIQPGNKAEILANDSKNNPVIVAGNVSRGRIVAIGFPMGNWTSPANEYKSKLDYLAPLPDGEKKILINSIKWCAAKPRYIVSQGRTNLTLLTDVIQYNNQAREAGLSKWKNLPPPHFDDATMTINTVGSNSVICFDSEEKIIQAVENCKRMGITTIRVYASTNKFYYPTKLYPEEILPANKGYYIFFKTQISDEFDPLEIFVREARNHGLKVAVYTSPFKSSKHWLDYYPNLTSKEAEKIRQGKITARKLKRKYWSCPDHPKVRERSLRITKEIIERYHPDEIWLDYIRTKNCGACFCDYSEEKRKEFAEKHPELSSQSIVDKHFEKSIVSFVNEWTKFCKKLQPGIKTGAYTLYPLTWINKVEGLDYHSKRVSRGLADNWATLEAVQSSVEQLCPWVMQYHSDRLPYPFVDFRDNKSGNRLYTEFKIISDVMNKAKLKKKYIDCFCYSLFVDKSGKINEEVAIAISKALGGSWK